MPITSTLVPATFASANVIEEINAVPPWDEAGVVSLITVAFIEAEDIDESTIPASTNFAPVTANGPPAPILDETGRKCLVYPEPVGGWVFPSISTGFPVTVHGYRVDTGSDFVGCKQITPISVPATGVNVILGPIAMRPQAQLFVPPGSVE